MYSRLRSHIANLFLGFKSILPKIHLDIPFYSQWESIELVDQILKHELEAKDDPKWKQSGASSPEDYQYWSWNLCGTACLKMILKFTTGKEYKLFDLARKITQYGGYVPRDQNTIDGLFHIPFVNYLSKEWKMKSETTPLTEHRIKYELSHGNFILASVNGAIRDDKANTPVNKTGHLLLVVGYDESKHCFYLNNPSGYYNKSQKDHAISYTDFERFFSKRGIIIYGKK